MSQQRKFELRLKNDQIIELEFTSIEVANNQLWQMFATTQALDTVQQLIDTADTTQTKSARKTAPEKPVPPKNKK
jgi:TPP-dependent 2-oxoacid decarboxylase